MFWMHVGHGLLASETVAAIYEHNQLLAETFDPQFIRKWVEIMAGRSNRPRMVELLKVTNVTRSVN